MRYLHILEGTFISRPNRFIAQVLLPQGTVETCHVKNTGRCKEILIPGTKVILDKAQNPNRKTAYDLIAAYKNKLLINIDSQAPNKAFDEWVQQGLLFKNIQQIKREVTYRHSRFDFWMKDHQGKEHFIEVKGVTLEDDGRVLFPDAPTLRGVKHIEELMEAKKEGFGAHVFFVIQLKGATTFSPNNLTHSAFGDALRQAKNQGVRIHAYDCLVTPDTMVIDQPVAIAL